MGPRRDIAGLMPVGAFTQQEMVTRQSRYRKMVAEELSRVGRDPPGPPRRSLCRLYWTFVDFPAGGAYTSRMDHPDDRSRDHQEDQSHAPDTRRGQLERSLSATEGPL